MTTKQLFVLPLAFAASVLAASCNDNKSSESTSTADTTQTKSVTEVANQAATAVKETVASNPDSSFVAEVALANNTEINMLQNGMKMATDKMLKGHAKMMLKDHQDLKKKVETWAASKNYPIPMDDAGNADKELNDIKDKTGKDWDKAFVNDLISAHEKTIGKFEGAQNNVKDADLKALITATLPTLRSHLDMAKKLQDQMK